MRIFNAHAAVTQFSNAGFRLFRARHLLCCVEAASEIAFKLFSFNMLRMRTDFDRTQQKTGTERLAT